MDQSDQLETCFFTSSISSDPSPSTTVRGTGYINMGPLSAQHYEIPSPCVHEIHRKLMNSTEQLTNNNEYDFKILLLGDSGVGKTCLLIRFNDETFTGNFHSTVGIDYRNKLITLGNKKINLQVFDTAGQERFRSVPKAYYRNANALLLIYDVTSFSSFESITGWLNEVKESTDNDTMIMIIGNKVDKSQRVISRELGERLATDYQTYFLETSAKTGQNVELAFMTTAQALLDKRLHSDNAKQLSSDKIKLKHLDTHYYCC